MIRIVNYTEDNKTHIRLLNEEWLRKYASIEEIDVAQLSNPKAEIIDKGGLIYYALFGDEIAGTATLMKRDASTFELSKMAVTEKFQGKGIGNRLMEYCIAKARENQAVKLILYSHTKLEVAIHLYEKFGFVEIPLLETTYKRANIKMELLLS